MSMTTKFGFGDQVRHSTRPEWGVGAVTKVELVASNGSPTQRVSVRFPNAGLKTLSTAHAALVKVTRDEASGDPDEGDGFSVRELAEKHTEGWLSGVAEKKIREKMTALPMDARDRFNSLERRLRLTLELYRFDRSGRGLVDWAVAQTDMDDPMTHFNRHELEQFFDRWAHAREAHLAELIGESRGDDIPWATLLADAPQAGASAVRRLGALR